VFVFELLIYDKSMQYSFYMYILADMSILTRVMTFIVNTQTVVQAVKSYK